MRNHQKIILSSIYGFQFKFLIVYFMASMFKNLHLNLWPKWTALFLTYFISGTLALKLDAVSGFATLFWPPTGLSFAALYLLGIRLWPGIFLGAFAANFLAGAPVAGCLGIAIGNTLEAVAAAYIFKKAVGPESGLDKVKDVFLLVVLVAGLSTLISSSIGVGSLLLSGVISKEAILSTWSVWWIGDILSNLVIAPICLIFKSVTRVRILKFNKLEACALGFTVLGLCYLIFGFPAHMTVSQYIKPYWLFPLLIWATLRFGHFANIIVVFTISGFAILAATQNLGPFGHKSLHETLFALQILVGAFSITGLFFGALGIEREKALQARLDFLSVASHELRTPITTLALKFEVLKALCIASEFKNDPEMVKRNIDSCVKHLKRLSALVDDLLDITRLESGKLKLNCVEVDLEVLIREFTESLYAQLVESGCKLELKLEKNVLCYCDPCRIEQLVSNLLSNAMKYGKGGPIIVSLTNQDHQACIKVQDFGVGIKREDHSRVFERFERVKTDYNINGLGLGLFISKQIVEAHSGSMNVESGPEKGSMFKILLPLTSKYKMYS